MNTEEFEQNQMKILEQDTLLKKKRNLSKKAIKMCQDSQLKLEIHLIMNEFGQVI